MKRLTNPLLSSLIPVLELIRDYLVLCKPNGRLQGSVLPRGDQGSAVSQPNAPLAMFPSKLPVKWMKLKQSS